MTIRPDLKKLLPPLLRLGLVLVGGVGVIVLTDLAVTPLIRESEIREANAVLSSLAPGGTIGDRTIAFPFSLSETQLNEQILSLCRDDGQRQTLLTYYQPDGASGFQLKKALREADRQKLSQIMVAIGYKSLSPVIAYYPVASSRASLGYILELTGRSARGRRSILAYYEADGTLREAKLKPEAEGAGRAGRSTEENYVRAFLGKKGAELPLTGRTALDAGATLSDGSVRSFLELGMALRDGSFYVARLGVD